MNDEPEAHGLVEQRLIELLELLRAEGPDRDEAVIEAVLATLQWQLLVRGALGFVGDLVGSMAGMLALFLSSPSKREEQP
jgi:hypothetical protein